MKLILMRHAEAEGMRSSDAERRLTARGEKQAGQVAEWLRRQLGSDAPAQLLSSPYNRTRQTAGILGDVLDLAPQQLEALTPDTDPRLALRAIAGIVVADTVIVVTHMPLVAALSSWMEEGVLTSGQSFALAEARVLELESLSPGMACTDACYVPDA